MVPIKVIGFAALGLSLSTAAHAHPHVFVDAKAEIVFDKKGEIAAIRNIWEFDQAFSEFAIQGLDTDGDGKLSAEELKPLAAINVKSLKAYGFFTYLRVDESEVVLSPATEYRLEFRGGRLTLFFTLPLKQAAAAGKASVLEIFDPEYFVAFDFPKQPAVKLEGAPSTCTWTYHAPQELDAKTMAVLAAIPVDQRNLPPDLAKVASKLASYFEVGC